MFDSLFGTEPSVAKFVIAFAVVIGLIALAAWLVRRFGANRLGNNATRGRQPRLAVIDAAPVDGRRRLLLIRRDNVEHLLMIGGPTDVVVEQNLVRATARDTAREPMLRTAPETATSWPLQPSPEPAPIMPAQPRGRSSFGDEPTSWTPPEPTQPAAREPLMPLPPREPPAREPHREPQLGPAPIPMVEPTREAGPREPVMREPAFREPPKFEPTLREPPLREPEPAPRATDHNLAEMASRLEAALRRPPHAEGRPPVTDPLAVPAAPKAPEVKAPEFRAPEFKAPDVAPAAKPAEVKVPQPATSDMVTAESKSAESKSKPAKPATNAIYDNLEQEMASLLGRPATKQ
ncbi:MAG: flagellar biosynthetic protein FliO [Pseudolabrys sp.]